MNLLLTHSWDYHTKLSTQMEKSSEHVEILKKFFEEIQMANEQHAKTLNKISEQFYQDISTEIIENEVLLCCYNHICHFVLNISNHHMNIANDIHNKILEPFQLFCENFQETNKALLKSGQALIEELENSKIELLKSQERYYKKAKESEKFIKQNEHMVKKLESGKKGQEDLSYFTYELNSRQGAAEQAGKEYKSLISNVNKQWETYDTSFYAIFDDFDLNEESRVHFTRLNITQMVKLLQEQHTEIYNSMNDYSMQNFENKLKIMEESLAAKKQKGGSGIIDPLDFNQAMKLTKREEFVSYESYKKLNVQKKTSSSKATMHMQKENIENFLTYILEENKNKISNKENENPKNKTRNSNSLNSLASNEDSTIETVASFIDGDTKLSDMLSSATLRKYFLERFAFRTKDLNEWGVSNEKWTQLLTAAALLTETMSKDELGEHEQVYNLITFLTKFYKDNDDDGAPHRFLGAHIYNKQIWKELNFWENLCFYLVHKRKLEEYRKGSNPSLSSNENDREEKKNEGKSIMQGLKKRFDSFMDQPKNVKIDEDSIKALVMDEMNMYISRLRVEQCSRSKVIMHVAKKINLDSASLNSIKNELDKDDDLALCKKISQRWDSHDRKLQKKGKHIFIVSLALDFLNYKDNLTNLLLVNREWRKKLEKKVYKKMLAVPDEKLTLQKRLSIWKCIIHLSDLKINYFQIKQNTNLLEQKVLPVEDIITMDVQRSFHNHPNINTMILYNLLRLFAHYNKAVSYCQGMNYIMGFLFCLFRDEDLAFRFFVATIDKYMTPLFEHDLESLKVAFYQLDRMIGIFLPELAKQFKKEGIDSSLFSASWFITVFTNVFQYSHTSYTLMRIWDTFLLEGWKGLFKVCLYVLQVYRQQLSRMRFDEMLAFLNDLSSKEFFTNFKYNENLLKQNEFFEYQPDADERPIMFFATQIDEIKVSKHLLRNLEEEFWRLNPPKAVSNNRIKE